MSDEEVKKSESESESDWGYPAFARDFPRDAELEGLVRAFARGDYRAVRDGAPLLAAREGVSDEVRHAARVLRGRIEPDRAARVFFVLAAALLVFLSLWWMTHDRPESHAPPPPPTVEIIK